MTSADLHGMDEICIERGIKRGLSPLDPAAGPPGCMIPGDSDFYGFGVRMGVYLTWISSWIANNFVSSEMAGSLDTNAVFLFALALTVVVLTAQKDIWAIDSNILLQLSFGFVFGVMTMWGRRTSFYQQGHFGGWGTHSRLVLCMAVSVYSLWFWVYGVQHPDPNCFRREACNGLRTFFFADVSMTGWARVIWIIVSAVVCVYFGAMSIMAIILLVFKAIRHERWEAEELELNQSVRMMTRVYPVSLLGTLLTLTASHKSPAHL
jgi:hypothetical protein